MKRASAQLVVKAMQRWVERVEAVKGCHCETCKFWHFCAALAAARKRRKT